MNLATLRVEGTETALSALRSLLDIKPNIVWKCGDPKRRGGVHSSSGFSATIADAPNPGALMLNIHNFLVDCRQRNLLISSDISVELAIGITVGDSQQFVACLDFAPADMILLGTLGFQLTVAAYPTSDEANAST